MRERMRGQRRLADEAGSYNRKRKPSTKEGAALARKREISTDLSVQAGGEAPARTVRAGRGTLRGDFFPAASPGGTFEFSRRAERLREGAPTSFRRPSQAAGQAGRADKRQAEVAAAAAAAAAAAREGREEDERREGEGVSFFSLFRSCLGLLPLLSLSLSLSLSSLLSESLLFLTLALPATVQRRRSDSFCFFCSALLRSALLCTVREREEEEETKTDETEKTRNFLHSSAPGSTSKVARRTDPAPDREGTPD